MYSDVIFAIQSGLKSRAKEEELTQEGGVMVPPRVDFWLNYFRKLKFINKIKVNIVSFLNKL